MEAPALVVLVRLLAQGQALLQVRQMWTLGLPLQKIPATRLESQGPVFLLLMALNLLW